MPGSKHDEHIRNNATDTLERMRVENALQLALQRGELTLHYQPIVCVQSMRVVGAEALIRRNHPDGIRYPEQFIPIAEQSDLILAIGAWAIEHACRQIANWKHLNLWVAVNVSARQMAVPNFAQSVMDTVVKHGVDPSRLVLELTETTQATDSAQAICTISNLRQRGLRVAIDDFGTGYNSLANLRACSVDVLKIDRSFIKDILKSPNDRAIVSAVLCAGKNLGIGVVAEGVETERHFDLLRSLGCDNAQGYWFSQAVPAEQFVELMSSIGPISGAA